MKNKYLEILELAPGATKKELKVAYRRLSKLYHPDVNKEADAHDRFVEIAEAYNFLTKVGPNSDSRSAAYDYDPFVSEYEEQRKAARARAKQRARDVARMQEQTIKRVLFVFKQVSIIIILFNVLLTLDYFLPRKENKQDIVGVKLIYEGKKRSDNTYASRTDHSYEDVYFEDFIMRFKKGEVMPLNIEKQAVVLSTQIFKKPMRAIFTVDGQPEYRNQLLGIFKVFGFLIPAILIMALLYLFVMKSLDQRLNLAVVMVVFFLIQLFIYIRF